MSELTIVTLCHVLSNLTHNRCTLVDNSNTCRCTGELLSPTATATTAAAPTIMLSEVFLIFFVLALWLSAIGFCLNQYKSLRRLETQVHYCISRKDPLNIGDIKIVTREQDSIIYKKKRYSTVVENPANCDRLKAMHYVQQYLPKTSIKLPASTLSALVITRDDLMSNVPLSQATEFHSVINIPLSTHHEVAEEQSLTDLTTGRQTKKFNGKLTYVHRTGSARVSTELTVPHISSSSSLRSSWNDPKSYETSCSTQHLCVPSNRLRTNRYSDGNISLPVPRFVLQSTEPNDEQLLDPRLIPECVRRSLLALHRESQENVNMQRHREKTQSENDVHGSFHPWKIKMKAKLRRTHHHQQQLRPHSNTLAILPTQQNSADRDRPMTDLIAVHSDQRYSTPVSHSHSRATTPTVRRSLIHYTKYSTQSTSESETTTHGDLPPMTTNSNDEQEQEEEKEKGFGETADKILSPSSS